MRGEAHGGKINVIIIVLAVDGELGLGPVAAGATSQDERRSAASTAATDELQESRPGRKTALIQSVAEIGNEGASELVRELFAKGSVRSGTGLYDYPEGRFFRSMGEQHQLRQGLQDHAET